MSRFDRLAGNAMIRPSRMKFRRTAGSFEVSFARAGSASPDVVNEAPVRLSWRDRDAERVGACDLRARLVEHVELGDRKARRLEQVDYRPGEVTHAGEALLNRVQAPLPPAHVLVGS